MARTLTTPDGHVVHLLHYWGDAIAPESLRVKPRLSAGTRAALWVLLIAARPAGSGRPRTVSPRSAR